VHGGRGNEAVSKLSCVSPYFLFYLKVERGAQFEKDRRHLHIEDDSGKSPNGRRPYR